jgi:ureidoglycolate lyase
MAELRPKPLTRAAFKPYGNVLDVDGIAPKSINQGFAQRFNDLCTVDVAREGGAVNVSFFAARPRPRPLAITLMERHPLGTQAFVPMQNEGWLVLVCDDPAEAETFHLFSATGRQGVNYAANTWHHPLLVFQPGQFLIIDRKGPGNNLVEVDLAFNLQISA